MRHLVVLEADPLEDIANTQRIRAVVANGKLYDRAVLDALLTGAERAAQRSRTESSARVRGVQAGVSL